MAMREIMYLLSRRLFMTRLSKFFAVLLTSLLCVSLVACSSFNLVKTTLEEVGYQVVQNEEDGDDRADTIQEESEVAVTCYMFTNADSITLTQLHKLNIVIVFEFKATDEMIEFYEDSETLQGLLQDIKDDGTAEEFYNDLVAKGYAKGNCLIFSTNPLASQDVRDAIKNA